MDVARSRRMRRSIALTSATLAILAVISCRDHDYDLGDCDFVVRRCRLVCTDWCDQWGCYPTCYDQCWSDCHVDPTPPHTTPPPSSPSDAASPLPTDGGGQAAVDGGGVLCTSCNANDDCETGALCIFRGGPPPDAAARADGGAPSGRGFCGHACQGPADCPQHFTCTNLGGSKRCLANEDVCRSS